MKRLIPIFYYLLFILVPLVWLPNTSELFEFNKLILTYILTTLIAGTWLIRMIIEKKIIFKRTILDIPLLIFLGFSILSLVFSIDVHTSWLGYYSRWNGGLLSLISYSLLYWAFVSNMDSKSALRAVRCALWAAATVAVYGSLEHFGFSISCLLTTGSFNVSCWVQDVQNRVFATLGQPNWLAAYIVALIFIPLSNITPFNPPLKLRGGNPKGEGDIWKISVNFAIFILLFATLLFTKSRSGLLAFGISSLVFWGLSFGKKTIMPMIIFAISISSLILIFQNPIRDLVFKPTVAEKTVGTALESGGTESGSIRKIVWTGATRIWTSNIKNLLIGTGPETFAMAYYQYRPLEHNQTSEWELLYNKAHNEFLNYLAATGLLGLTSYLILLGSMLWIFKSQILNTNNQINSKNQIQNILDLRILNLGFFAGWLTISITNFWGFSVVVMQLFLFLLPAIAITLNDQ